MKADFIRPDWPVPARVRALTTTRRPLPGAGASLGAFAALNLGDQVGDRPAAVAENRRWLKQAAALPANPRWLRQVHGRRVVALPQAPDRPEADAAFTTHPGTVCAVLTADCLPVFLADQEGRAVGLAHAGWRGLALGVIEALVAAMPVTANSLHAWLGPAIGPAAFQVGDEVRETFLAEDAGAAEAFRADTPGHWRADLPALARRRLQALGVASIGGGRHCSHSEPDRFFSHRREAPCGRMASLIWLEPAA